jgi:hypothetical protein
VHLCSDLHVLQHCGLHTEELAVCFELARFPTPVTLFVKRFVIFKCIKLAEVVDSGDQSRTSPDYNELS